MSPDGCGWSESNSMLGSSGGQCLIIVLKPAREWSWPWLTTLTAGRLRPATSRHQTGQRQVLKHWRAVASPLCVWNHRDTGRRLTATGWRRTARHGADFLMTRCRLQSIHTAHFTSLLPCYLKHVKNVKSFPSLGWRWSPFPKALSQTPVFTLRDHGYGASVSRGCLFTSQRWSLYQIILLGDRGTCVWTTCLRSLPGSVPVRNRTCASELPQDYKSDTLPLDYRATPETQAPINKHTRRFNGDSWGRSSLAPSHLILIWKFQGKQQQHSGLQK